MNAKTNGALPAHPVDERNDDGSIFCTHLGLTKRELFAAMAMQGLLASGRSFVAGVANDAVANADALLAALTRPPATAEQRARELLDAESAFLWPAQQYKAALRAVTAALTPESDPEPEARGVVDEVWLFKGTDGAWHTFLDERHRLDTIADGRWDVRKFATLGGSS